MYQLWKNDKLLCESENENTCWYHLQSIQSQSADWACKYEGYKVIKKGEENNEH